MRVPSSPETREKIKKFAHRAVRRWGKRDIREYPIPSKFARWKDYYFVYIRKLVQG